METTGLPAYTIHRYLGWDKEANNQKSIAKVEELYHNDKLYEDFMAQVKLLPAAEEYVIDRYARLKDKFAELLF